MTFYLKAGLAGFPVGHSLSPLIHGVFMESAGIPGTTPCSPWSPKHWKER